MEMVGSYDIPAARPVVWAALNDPDALRACIPGCQSLERTAENQMAATAVMKIGPVKATFKGNVTLSEIDPARSYKITGEGSGGAAGFAKGGAVVRLEDIPAGTRLTYEAKADVGGKMAQLGARLIDGVAKKMADEFFDAFSARFPAPVAAGESASLAQAQSEEPKIGFWRRILASVTGLFGAKKPNQSQT